MEKILEFLFENFQFLVVKFSIYLNRCVFVMKHLTSYGKFLFLRQHIFLRYVDSVPKFVFQYLTTMKLTSGYAFNYIVLGLLP